MRTYLPYLYFQVIEYFHRLMKNADYDLKEKSDIEVLAVFEGSGVETSDIASETEQDYHIVDENFDHAVEENAEEDGSTE